MRTAPPVKASLSIPLLSSLLVDAGRWLPPPL
jgi:hypothetical protein